MSSEANAAAGEGEGRIVGAARKIEERVAGAREVTDRTVKAAKAKVEAARETAREKGKIALQKGEEGLDHVADYVRENPLKSVGAALGVGVILGLLIGRR
jgi:ElaB/YqjD/DUF883 family membrane-anchored ribosome-binding protein